jgi:acetyl esterase/lipase
MQAVLAQIGALRPLPVEMLSPRQARELPSFADGVRGVLAQQGRTALEAVGSIGHRIVPGGPGSDGSLVRIYTPAVGQPPFPVLVYFHGGGFVIHSIDVWDASCRALANAAGCLVVSVAYRLAPENPFPAAPEDAFAAYQWAIANAGAIGGDGSRVAVGGESAGGSLAAAVAIMARDRGAPPPLHQLLIYPFSDLLGGADRPSALQYADARPLNRGALLWFIPHYLPDPAAASDPLASPVLADLRGLPPATVISAEIDPLRDTGRAHAEALMQAGVPTEYRLFEGVTHAFFTMSAVLDRGKEAVDLVAAQLGSAYAGNPP